jgi:hypothetical protein
VLLFLHDPARHRGLVALFGEFIFRILVFRFILLLMN